MNLLGEIFWGYVHGVVTKLSSKFGWIWTSFARDLRFGALLAGCLGETGLTGLQFEIPSPTGLTGLCNRSDRSLQSSSAFRLALLPRCDLGLLLRDSWSIAILADLGWRASVIL